MVYAFGYGHGFGLGFLNLLGTLLFFLVLFWAIKFFIRGGRSLSFAERHEDEAVTTARERLARGEISAEEFEKIRQGLGVNATRPSDWAPWQRWGRDRAMDIARVRFARGELTLQEFEAVKRALQH